MKAPPDLDPALIVDALQQHWAIRARDMPYLAVGFGDHHWDARADGRRCFVTVRDLRLDGRTSSPASAMAALEQTFRAVRALKNATALPFIVPALPSTNGSIVVPLTAEFALTVYDWLDVRDVADSAMAVGVVSELHRASRAHPVDAVREDFQIPHRQALEAALRELDRPWQTGPFGEPARGLLATHHAAAKTMLREYDTLAHAAGRSTDDWCLTHGEPSGPNLVQDGAGQVYLVDWESARIGPPERDLWQIDLTHYAGPSPREAITRLYRLWWDLAETAVYVLQFRTPHTADENMVESWRNFQTYLPR